MKAKKSQKQEDNLDCYHILALNNLLFTTSWASTDLQMRSLWKQQPCYLIIQLEQQVVNKALKQKQIGSKIITLV